MLWFWGQLQQEVDRLEELKLQNLKSVIQAIRAELAHYWDKCFYSQEQRDNFSHFYDGGCWLAMQFWGALPRAPDPDLAVVPFQRITQRRCSSSMMLRCAR